MQVEPEKKPARRRGWLLLAALAVGLVVAWGADRQPADATKPIAWREFQSANSSPTDVLRIASYNIHGGKGADGKVDLQRIAQDLRDVEFAGLFEVHASHWSGVPDQAAALGNELKLRSAFLATERRWHRDHFGNAVLTSLPVRHVQRIPLIGTRGKAFRQAVLVDVPLQGQIVHVLMSHVDSQQDREPQLKAVIQLFHALKSPAILMGDLNTGPRDPLMVELLSQPGVASVLDPSAQDRIDWIITRGLDCVDAECVASGASDHPVIRATLKIAH